MHTAAKQFSGLRDKHHRLSGLLLVHKVLVAAKAFSDGVLELWSGTLVIAGSLIRLRRQHLQQCMPSSGLICLCYLVHMRSAASRGCHTSPWPAMHPVHSLTLVQGGPFLHEICKASSSRALCCIMYHGPASTLAPKTSRKSAWLDPGVVQLCESKVPDDQLEYGAPWAAGKPTHDDMYLPSRTWSGSSAHRLQARQGAVSPCSV